MCATGYAGTFCDTSQYLSSNIVPSERGFLSFIPRYGFVIEFFYPNQESFNGSLESGVGPKYINLPGKHNYMGSESLT